MLGAIAITSGTRTLDTYVEDMKKREQTKERIDEVCKALNHYNDMLKNGKIHVVRGDAMPKQGNVEESKSNTKSKVQTQVSSSSSSGSSSQFSGLRQELEKMIVNDLTEDKVQHYRGLIELKKQMPDKVSNDLVCPLSGNLFFDPVMTCDGQTFERKAIELWFKAASISPISHQKLDNKNLIPNFIVKKMVDELFNANKSHLK